MIIIACCSLSGCNFDKHRELSLAFPVVIIAENLSDKKLNIVEIYSDPKLESAFILNGDALDPGKTLTVRAPRSAYDIMTQKAFFVAIKCASSKIIDVKGENIEVVVKEEGMYRLLIDNPCPDTI